MVTYTEGFDHASTDTGYTLITITSTEEEKKKVRAVVIAIIAAQSVLLGVTLEREDISKDIPFETLIHRTPFAKIPINLEIPVGQTLKVIAKPQVAGSQGTVTGWVEYEITG